MASEACSWRRRRGVSNPTERKVEPIAKSPTISISSTARSDESVANSTATTKKDELAGVGLSFYAQIYVLKVPIAELTGFHRVGYYRSLSAACARARMPLPL
mgnify:CR=1 FL=1